MVKIKIKTKHIVYCLIFIMISVLTMSLTGYIYRVNKVSSNFEYINKDDSENVVINKLGQPQEVGKCGENLWWDGQFVSQNQGSCKKEFKYFCLGDLEFWIVGFDEQGKVISKYHGGSP